MSEREPTTSITWPMVALIGLVLAFLVGIFVVIPDDEPQGRTAVLGVIILAGQAVVAVFIRGKVNGVHKEVNGRMTQLINEQQEATRQLKDAHATIAALTGKVPTGRPKKDVPR